MTTRYPLAAALAAGCLVVASARAQPAVGTAFTYQGRLVAGAGPANGVYDFRFALFDASSGGNPVGSVVTADDVTVTSGLFTTRLDFGTGIFAGGARWLEIGVRPGSNEGAYTTLAGRQELTPTPNATYSSAVPWSGIGGKPIGFADDTDNDTLGTLSCPANQVPQWSGSAWGCAASLPPTGPAGGSLAGAYPSPAIAPGAVGAAQLSAAGSTAGQALVSTGAAASWGTPAIPSRKYYLSLTPANGAAALTACAAGYHMASFWEIFNPSVLVYETTLGYANADSGSGPPNGTGGWVRTGHFSDTGTSPGTANCAAWTSSSNAHRGSHVNLTTAWAASPLQSALPWFALAVTCDSPVRVWCVQD